MNHSPDLNSYIGNCVLFLIETEARLRMIYSYEQGHSWNFEGGTNRLKVFSPHDESPKNCKALYEFSGMGNYLPHKDLYINGDYNKHHISFRDLCYLFLNKVKKRPELFNRIICALNKRNNLFHGRPLDVYETSFVVVNNGEIETIEVLSFSMELEDIKNEVLNIKNSRWE